MARNSRQQRRARRREAAGEAAERQPAQAPAATGQRARARPQQARPAAAPPREQAGRHEPRQRGRFVRESWAELNKVEWPGRNQVLAGSVVVIIACAIVGAYLWVTDLALQRLVERVLL